MKSVKDILAFIAPSTVDDLVYEQRLKILIRILIGAALFIPFAGMVPELIWLTPDLNDGAFHIALMQNTIAAMHEGLNPLDFWIPTWLCGYPIFHYYQPLPYLLLAAVHFFCLGQAPALVLYRLVTILLMIIFPLANYKAIRWLGFGREEAGAAAVLSWMISSQTYGIEFISFTWAGWGLFAQAAALPFLPLAMAGGYRAVRDGGNTSKWALIGSITMLMHILYGYITLLSLIFIPFIDGKIRLVPVRLIRLIRYTIQLIAFAAFFLIPLMTTISYHAKSKLDAAQKFDSLGAKTVLINLVNGSMFDKDRMPVLSILIWIGLYLCCVKWWQSRDMLHGWFVVGFSFAIIVYFGRATWGELVKLLPLSNGLHMERLSNGVHIFGLWLGAVTAGVVFRKLLRLERKAMIAGILLFFAVVLYPMIAERSRYMIFNAKLEKQDHFKFKQDMEQFKPILDKLAAEPAGRVYAGHSGNWGKTYTLGEVPVYQVLAAHTIDDIGHMPYSWSLVTDFQAYFNQYEPYEYDMYDIRYVITNQSNWKPPTSQLLLQSGPHYLYRITASGGRFDLVSVPVAIKGDKENSWHMTMHWLQSALPKAKNLVRLMYTPGESCTLPTFQMVDGFHYIKSPGMELTHVFDLPAPFSLPPVSPSEGTLDITSISRQEATLNATLLQPGAIRFKTTYHPFWRAYIDGEKTRTYTVTPGMIAFDVPAGAHSIRVAYGLSWLKLVLLVSGIIIAICLDRWGAISQLSRITQAPKGY